MELIAHRGFSARHHENTIDAYESALSLPIKGIEVDVHQVQGEFYLFHDFDLQRLTGQTGNISEQSKESMALLRLKNGAAIPTLDDLFALTKGQCLLNLELKSIDDIALLCHAIYRYICTYDGELVLSSFNHRLIKNVQQLLRHFDLTHKVRTAGIIAHLPENGCQFAIDLGADLVAIDANVVDEDFVRGSHNYNLEVWCYTVNTVTDARHLASIGVDAVFTNDPALLSTVIKATN